MDYRSLGRTGVMVSELCLGCMNFGGVTTEADDMDIIDQAIDEGINFLDTANVYLRGGSEIVVGKALKRNGKRDNVVLATKVHGRMDDDDILAAGNNRRHIIQQCEASLQRLQTDYIDLYQIHRPNSNIPVDETLRALDDLIRAGKVRYIGSSTFPAWRVLESFWVAKELGLNRFVSEQPPLSPTRPKHRTRINSHGAKLWHGNLALVAIVPRIPQRQIPARRANSRRQPFWQRHQSWRSLPAPYAAAFQRSRL